MSSEIETLIDEFTAAAVEYGDAMKIGDPRSAKRHRDRVATAYRRLVEHGGTGQASLLALLATNDLAVRYMTAVHALDFAPTEGERVLIDIMNGPPSPLRLLAQISLSQWRSGMLRF
ncbi:MAG: DUF2019 domain-containing protein [Thermoanaerobaculia bacterium]|nr:DUF2019 domain-containing protein [Thermoanaerobaculia bacterium]